MTWGDVFQVMGIVGPAVGVYAAVRADLAKLHAIASGASQSADKAHNRIDGLYREGRR